MKVFIDMDGVLVDLVSGAAKVHNVKNPYDLPENRGVWEMHPMFGLSEKDFWVPMNSHAFWAGLNPMPDAFEILDFLKSYFPLEQLCILSTPTHSPHSLSGKMVWLQKHLPEFSRRYTFSTLKEFSSGKGKLLFDDKDENVNSFREAGGEAILVPRPWNSLHEINTMEYLKQQFLMRG